MKTLSSIIAPAFAYIYLVCGTAYSQINDLERVEDAIKKQKATNEEVQERIAVYKKEAEEAVEAAKESESFAEKKRHHDEQLKSAIGTLFEKEDEFLAIEAIATAYRQKFRPKQTLNIKVGDSFEKLAGTSYQNITITRVSPEQVNFSHSNGLGTFKNRDLPSSFLKKSIATPQTAGPYKLSYNDLIKLRPRDIILRFSGAELLRRDRILAEQKNQQAELEWQRKAALAAEERKQFAAKNALEAEQRKAEIEADQAKAEARKVEADKIKAQIAVLTSKRTAVYRSKSQLESSFRSATNTPDRKKHAAAIAEFDRQIDSYSASITTLRDKASALYR